MSRLLLVSMLTLVAAAPAQATDTPVWYDAGAGIPATVTLNAVAAGEDVVVAVGADGDVPVAYRLTDGAWTRTELAPAGTAGAATDVAVDEYGRGVVVGWQRAGAEAPVRALLERVDLDGTWEPVETGAAPALTAVAANADFAFVGDSTGAVRTLTYDGLGAPLSWLTPVSATAIRSLALTSGLSAIGGGAPASGAPAATALLDVDGASSRVSQAPAVPADTRADIVAVAALADGHRIALDGAPCGTAATTAPGAWLPDSASGAWTRDTSFPTGTAARACDTTFTAAGEAVVVGSFDGRRAVWRHGAAWSRNDDLGAGELRGVATTADAAWAVGTAGTVLRYGIPPAPAPDPQPDPDPDPDPAPAPDPQPNDPGQPSGDANQTSGSSQDGGGEQEAQQQQQQQSDSDKPAVDVNVRSESDPEPVALGHTPQSQPAKRLLGRLTVRRLGNGRLRVSFRLRLPARLDVRALRGTRVIGRASRHLRAGTHQLILPYRGTKPPTRLDIVVRRSKAGPSKENTR